MNQLNVPKLVYTFPSQVAANQFLNAYSKSGIKTDTGIRTEAPSRIKNNTANVIILVLIGGLLVYCIYQANQQQTTTLNERKTKVEV
jgi:hypothetical protein